MLQIARKYMLIRNKKDIKEETENIKTLFEDVVAKHVALQSEV